MTHEGKHEIASIFVHAGAGFHSYYNEKAHLEICENAARAAMSLLKNGATAVDAVEMAIILLEDAEITNAGYGSNLTIHGTVECDATIVNHLGRSGAVGAVSQVKNPISVARSVLDASSRPLSLLRIPPNFLVGPGATEYAYEHGLVVLPHDALIAPAARERWQRWKLDLMAAEVMAREQDPMRYQHEQQRAYFRRPVTVHPAHLLASPSSTRDNQLPSSPLSDKTRLFSDVNENGIKRETPAPSVETPPPPSKPKPRSTIQATATANHNGDTINSPADDNDDSDQISDTVGAIAVDIYGNIAAGSSSGGIGMKHRGRVGPAALVGVGTTVIPVDPNDPDETCVATVTSGTGEHIATALAASTCASRTYYCQQKCEDGTYEEVTEDEALRTMIASDFMDHPGVKVGPCHGAIGIMSVKKTVDGTFLYFGHNTDSFALASMSSRDKKPVSVMSRSNGNGSIAQGGRAYLAKK